MIIKRYAGRSTKKQQAANAMNCKTLIENRVSLDERVLPMVKHVCNSYSDKYLQYNKKCNTKQCRSKHFLLISHVLPSVLVPYLTIYLLTATNTKGFWPVKWDSTNSFNNKYLPIMPQRFHLPHHHVGRHEHQDKATKTVADKHSSGDNRVFSRCNVLLEVHFDVKGGCISTSTN